LWMSCPSSLAMTSSSLISASVLAALFTLIQRFLSSSGFIIYVTALWHSNGNIKYTL
jgi:hypothetical protein